MPKSLFLNMIKDEMFKLRYARRTIETYFRRAKEDAKEEMLKKTPIF